LIGTTLSHFRVTAKLGEGGMGEVYRAEDTKLGREVAIKVLPEAFSLDPERLARFEREARVLASLNHPNIAAIYQVEEAADRHLLVMELVEGEDLATRLGRGPLPVAEVLSLAVQLAEALESAHEQGIIHRDLKPGNIMVRPDGTVKMLDFGLAKALRPQPEAAEVADLSRSPTVTADPTQLGVVLGTATYMSPEQARGRVVDKRADLWSLGCVLYESLVGRRPFDAATVPDLLVQILSSEPDFEALPQETPAVLVWLLRRCLEKDPRRRLRDAGELRVALEDYSTDPRSGPFVTPGPTARPTFRLGSLLPWLLVAVIGLGFLYLLATRPRATESPPLPVSRWAISLPAGERIEGPRLGGNFDYSRTVAVSPDASRIAFSVYDQENRARIFLKADEALPRPIRGTIDARAPFFSPDGEWLGFYVRPGGVFKVSLQGGAPQKICDLEAVMHFDASWSPDGDTIVFATDDGLSLVRVDDGSVQRLTEPDIERDEVGHHSPRFTADGRGVLFTISAIDGMKLVLLSLEQGEWKTILEDASLGVPLGQDRLVFARAGELLAVGYDQRNHRVVGSAVPVLQDVQTTPGLGGMVLTQFDISATGTLAYVPATTAQSLDQLLWVDHSGQETLIVEGAGTWVHPRLSPDGERISLDIHSGRGKRDVFIYEIDRGQFRELTSTGVSWESEWRPDGERIAIMSGAPAGRWGLFWAPTDFSRSAELLMPSSHAIPGSWLPDGESLLYTEWNEGGIWRYWPGAERTPEPIVHTSHKEAFPRLSPSGQWMAYVAMEAGRREVFVQSFPDLGPKYKISIEGGGEPVWSRDGKTLFYRKSGQMLAVEVTYQPEVSFGRPRFLFEGDYNGAAVGHQHYDVSLDGRRFLMIRHARPVGTDELRVVLGWAHELGSLLPRE
jgi:serine/threonine protein kinase/Tol biopolymer transport system component